jgi:lipopolysaccharide/colanic/teichoic acid biosynthesis glycosyltransferase
MHTRRVVDICAAALLLAVSSPLFLFLMVVNRLLAGRAFFRQTRIGRDLRPFVLLKFQTMVNGAETGSTVTVAQDPRITGYGRILRALKLDELPQLLNILRGEMSVLGPRPLTPNEVGAIPVHLATVVYRLTPGLTGISAVAFADEERIMARVTDPKRAYFEEVLPRKVALELAYAQRRTWITDLILVLFTPLAPYCPVLRRQIVVWLVPDWEALDRTAAGRGGGPVARTILQRR